MNLTNKTAIVTGGGRGIGLGITQRLLKAGASVLVAQRQPLPSVLQENDKVIGLQVDLLEHQAGEAIVQKALEQWQGVDILVNNAGIMFECELEDMTEADWDRMMALNVRTPAFVAQALVPHMRDRNASIVNIGSIEGIAANPQHIAYSTAKSAIHGMTKALAVDLGRYGIRCNSVAPGWIDSDLSRAYIESQPDPTAAHDGLLALHPVGRLGTPEDIGSLVAFLCSDESLFITGQVMVVDGGRTAKLPLSF